MVEDTGTDVKNEADKDASKASDAQPPTSGSSSSDEATRRAMRRKWIIENVKSFGIAIFLVLIIRSSIIEAFKIPSGSMIPTLMVGDHIFVNKFAYGLKVPFSDFFTDKPLYIVERQQPQRGDIIVFKYPKDESFYYIKRVIIANLEGRQYDKTSLELYNELNPTTNERHLVMFDKNSYINENYGETKVPDGHLFVMGDNRDFSNDSRFWGFVPFKNVRGKAMVIWLSLWIDFGEREFYFHPSRIGTIIK